MTEGCEPTRSTAGSDPVPAPTDLDPGDPQEPAHVVGAYSPRWLSGPSHYEGLVATFAPEGDDPDEPGATVAGAPA
jgi:hypothetical protein